MKNLIQLLLILAMTFALASCGKKDKGGSSSSSPAPVVDPIPTGDFYGGSETEFGNFDTLKAYYTGKSFADGISASQIIYHIGPDYGMVLNGGSFNVGFCIQFFGTTLGDCEGMGQGAILDGIVANGEYKVVESASVGGVSFQEATDVVDDQFVFEPRTFDANSEAFRAMLNLGNEPVLKVVVSQAQIHMTDGSTVTGDLVEYFYGTFGSVTGIDRFVLSKDLPLIANPIANFDAYGNPTGVLNNIGNRMVGSVSAMAN